MEKMTEDEFRKTIVIDARADVVFKALTDEKELVEWMPRKARMDLRVGGEYEFKYHWAERNLDSIAKGKILELVPNRKISYTWNAIRGDSTVTLKESIVTWILDDLPDGKTLVTLVNSGILKEYRQNAEGGWGHWLGELAKYCKS